MFPGFDRVGDFGNDIVQLQGGGFESVLHSWASGLLLVLVHDVVGGPERSYGIEEEAWALFVNRVV